MEEDATSKLYILHVVVSAFLPHVPPECADQQIYSQLLPQVPSILTSLLSGIGERGDQQVIRHNCESLKTVSSAISSLLECVSHTTMLPNPISLHIFPSLPLPVLDSLTIAFQHCKTSGEIYGSTLPHVSDTLSSVFRSSYTILRSILELLDRVGPGVQADVADVVSDDIGCRRIAEVIHSLLKLCPLVAALHPALHANTWRFILRAIVKHKGAEGHLLNHGDLCSTLACDLDLTFSSCLQLAAQGSTDVDPETRLLSRSFKLCRFLSSSLLKYTQEFSAHLDSMVPCLFNMHLRLYNKLPPNPGAVCTLGEESDKMRDAVFKSLRPLLSLLITQRSFCSIVLGTAGVPQELRLAHCLLVTDIMKALISCPGEQTSWLDGERIPILHCLLSSVAGIWPELALPIRRPVSDNSLPLPVYDLLLVTASAFISTLMDGYLPALEQTLIFSVFSRDVNSSLLAVDLWCYVARLGPVELCAHYVSLLLPLISEISMQEPKHALLSILLQRLFSFLPAEHQVKLIAELPPSPGSLPPCSVVLAAPGPKQACVQAICRFFDTALPACRWKEGIGHDTQAIAMQFLERLCMASALETSQLSQLTEVLHTIIDQLPAEVPEEVACALLSLSTHLVHCLSSSCLSKLLKLVPKASNHPLMPRLGALLFLCVMGKEHNDSQRKLPKEFPAIFHSLLSDDSWILHLLALQAFAHFAEVSFEAEIVPQCLRSEEVRVEVVAYITKRWPSLHGQTSESDNDLEGNQSESETLWRLKKEQEMLQDLRIEHAHPRLNSSLEKFEHGLEELGRMTQHHAPAWFIDRLKAVAKTIENMLSPSS
uniref:FIGNL1-interacting regulator of recombination and mitosis isoform X2 n=1 Tax=Myxine glutinosa TaxID=7769 RepID=UPI00358F4228